MTEQEFLCQVWRPYDTVMLENGISGRVLNVCFSTRSVRIRMPNGGPEWFRCELIGEHKSATGETNDLAIIEDLHRKLLTANMKIEELNITRTRLEEKLSDRSLENLITKINMINEAVREKRKKAEKVEACMAEVMTIIEKFKEE